jgi:hypothetical protein
MFVALHVHSKPLPQLFCCMFNVQQQLHGNCSCSVIREVSGLGVGFVTSYSDKYFSSFPGLLGTNAGTKNTIKCSVTVSIQILTYGLLMTILSVHSTLLNLGS